MSERDGWQELLDRRDATSARVLDVRGADAFAAGHLPGAANRPVPSAADPDALLRLLPGHVLPPRHEALLVVDDGDGAAARVAAWLGERGRDRVRAASPDWGAAPAGLLVADAAPGRLWEPPPWIAEHVDLLPPPSAGPVVDLGSGAGRAAVWLAERGYDVTAVDRHEEALGFARDLATDAGVTIRTLQADLTAPEQWPQGPWAVALKLRFLHRPLVQALPGLVAPGGVVVMRTFRWAEGPWTLPRRAFCLEPGELGEMFGPDSWETLAVRENEDGDGRPAAGVVARRRGAP